MAQACERAGLVKIDLAQDGGGGRTSHGAVDGSAPMGGNGTVWEAGGDGSCGLMEVMEEEGTGAERCGSREAGSYGACRLAARPDGGGPTPAEGSGE